MNVAVKRVYEPVSEDDGVRVLVDRLWPRGVTEEAAAVQHWLRDLAPSNELRRWFHANPAAWARFRHRYLKELTSPKAAAAFEKLHELASDNAKVTLLYASHNEKRNNATALKEHMEGAPKPPSGVGNGKAARQGIRKALRK